jgi:hypothetical protein
VPPKTPVSVMSTAPESTVIGVLKRMFPPSLLMMD